MLGAVYIGLSGMNAFSKGLQTISNNVANLNTPGFKTSSATFNDMFSYGGGGLTFSSQTSSEQAGNGVRFGVSQVDYSQGDLRQTSSDLDLAIQGSGFLVLKDGDKSYYTRTGQFAVDEHGFISLQGTTYHLATLNSSNQAEAVNIDAKRTSKPVATTAIKFADNISSTATDATVSNIAVYDSNGGAHTWQVKFTPKGAASPNEWQVVVTDETGATLSTSTLKSLGGIADPTTTKIKITAPVTGAAIMSVDLDFSSNVTFYSSGTTSTIRAAEIDGNGVGALTSVTVDAEGKIKLTYTNAKTETLGAIALADFRDPQQLTRVGTGLFQNQSSGQSRLLASGKDGIGKLVSKQIEASNVNLSQEFGDLILIQRGFQASSQVVSVANDMIQQLFGIRGQG